MESGHSKVVTLAEVVNLAVIEVPGEEVLEV